ncbi:MAG: nucleotide exchange factor GrpE [Actinomycetia bacterium]|nr:nucleotide exchange factor GrpE [Actinomycetes bacterium]
MTTGKKQIPLDHPGVSGDRADDLSGRRTGVSGGAAGTAPAAVAGSAQADSGRGASRATVAGAPSKAAPGGPHPAHGTSASQMQKLAAERDALAAERDALAAERDALAAQVEALTDSRLRLQAEFENFRKRATREAVESHARTQCQVLNDFLPILDNLERALEAAEHHEEGKVLTGVRMTRDMFASLLARAGVEEIEGVGAPFDPKVHEAVAVQPSDQEEGTVVAVVQRGYRQGDWVLRPARVVVSAGRADSVGTDATPSAENAGRSNDGAISR